MHGSTLAEVLKVTPCPDPVPSSMMSPVDEILNAVDSHQENPLARLCLCEDISVGDKGEQEKNRKPGNKGQVAQGAQPKKTGNQVFQEFQVFRDFRCFLPHGNSFA